MKKKIVLIIAVALLVCLVALTCFACSSKPKDIKRDDLAGRTYNFFTYNTGFSLYNYDFVFSYGIGETYDDYPLTEETMSVVFNKDGTSGVAYYSFKNNNETYPFNYTMNTKDENKIDIEIPSVNIKTTAKIIKDFIILDTDDIIAEGTSVYLRLE